MCRHDEHSLTSNTFASRQQELFTEAPLTLSLPPLKAPSGFPRHLESNPNSSAWPSSSLMDPSLPTSSHSSHLSLFLNH